MSSLDSGLGSLECTPSGNKRNLKRNADGDCPDDEKRNRMVADLASLPKDSKLYLGEGVQTDIRLQTFMDDNQQQGHKFVGVTGSSFAKRLNAASGARDVICEGDKLIHIGNLDVSDYDHELVVDMLCWQDVEQEDGFFITVKKRNSFIKIEFVELYIDGREFVIRVTKISGDKGDDIIDLKFKETVESNIFSASSFDKCMKWSKDGVCMAPKTGKTEEYVFDIDNFRGIDSTDNTAYVCSIRAFNLDNHYVCATKKGEVKLMQAERIISPPDKLGKLKPMMFRQIEFNHFTTYESLAYKGYFLSKDGENVVLKKIGKKWKIDDLQRTPDIQFQARDVIPQKETSV